MTTPEGNVPPPPREGGAEPAPEAAPAIVEPGDVPAAGIQPTGEAPALPAAAALPEDLRAPWGWADLFYFLLYGLASSIVLTWAVALGAMAIGGIRPWEIDRSAATKGMILIASQGLWSVATLLYLYAVLRARRSGSFWNTIGWRQLRPRTMTRSAATLLCLLGGVCLAVTIQVASALIGKRTKLPIEALFQSRQSVLLLMALGILVAPLVEETIFRGYIYPVVARKFGIPGGVIGTGALFGMAHAMQLWGGWGQIALLVIVGMVLTYVRARTGTVLASYLCHLGYNSILFVGFYFATGGLRHFPGTP